MANLVQTIQTAGLVRAPRGYVARPYQVALAPPPVRPIVGVIWPRVKK